MELVSFRMMGASAWDYWIDYTPNVSAALEALRSRVFESGDYYSHLSENPSSIEELVEALAEEGTHSILDIDHVSECFEYGAVWPLSGEELSMVFGTDMPTVKDVETAQAADKLDSLVPTGGTGRYLTTYRDDQPDKLFFFGATGD